jgi:hypothetical protein
MKAKSSQQSKCCAPKMVQRDLLKVNPKKEQFEPTKASPVSQHKRMAGAG